MNNDTHTVTVADRIATKAAYLAEENARKTLRAIAVKRAVKTAARKANRAIKKYGMDVCKEAHSLHVMGYGASGISHAIYALNGNTRAADSAIDAGRWLADNSTSNNSNN